MSRNRTLSHSLLLSLTCLLISACQPLVDFVKPAKPPTSTALMTLPVNDNWAEWVDFTERLYQQPPQTLTPLYREALANEQLNGTAIDKLNLVLLLAVPGTAFHDSKKALQLANEGLEMLPQTHNAIRDMLRLNRVNLLARQQLQQLVNEQKQQLEQLKSIEKNLVERRELLE